MAGGNFLSGGVAPAVGGRSLLSARQQRRSTCPWCMAREGWCGTASTKIIKVEKQKQLEKVESCELFGMEQKAKLPVKRKKNI